VEFGIEGERDAGLMCDCSLCKRKKAIMARVPKGTFRLVKGAGDVSSYQWNSKIAKHDVSIAESIRITSHAGCPT